VDQPFVRALTINQADQIYVGINDFSQANGQSATVDFSQNVAQTMRPLESKLAERRVKMTLNSPRDRFPDNTATRLTSVGALWPVRFSTELFGLGDSYCRHSRGPR